MLRKTLSLLLSIILVSTLCFGTQAIVSAKSTSLYKNKIKEAMKSCENCGSFYLDDGSGFLYDFDGNGVKELVLYYYKEVNDYPHFVMSAYTIKNKKVVTLVKKKILYADVAGPSGFVGVAKKNEDKYLICQGENGETGSGEKINRSGEFCLYKIKGAKITLKTKVKYKITSKNTSSKPKIISSEIKLNGKAKTYKQFINWQKSFKLLKAKRTSGWYWKYHYQSKGIKLNELLKKV